MFKRKRKERRIDPEIEDLKNKALAARLAAFEYAEKEGKVDEFLEHLRARMETQQVKGPS